MPTYLGSIERVPEDRNWSDGLPRYTYFFHPVLDCTEMPPVPVAKDLPFFVIVGNWFRQEEVQFIDRSIPPDTVMAVKLECQITDLPRCRLRINPNAQEFPSVEVHALLEGTSPQYRRVSLDSLYFTLCLDPKFSETQPIPDRLTLTDPRVHPGDQVCVLVDGIWAGPYEAEAAPDASGGSAEGEAGKESSEGKGSGSGEAAPQSPSPSLSLSLRAEESGYFLRGFPQGTGYKVGNSNVLFLGEETPFLYADVLRDEALEQKYGPVAEAEGPKAAADACWADGMKALQDAPSEFKVLPGLRMSRLQNLLRMRTKQRVLEDMNALIQAAKKDLSGSLARIALDAALTESLTSKEEAEAGAGAGAGAGAVAGASAGAEAEKAPGLGRAGDAAGMEAGGRAAAAFSEAKGQEESGAAGGAAVQELPPRELADCLCARVKTVRPRYTRNEILNIAICLTQNLLTVFSGPPGCGKTSICKIFSKALGLDKAVGGGTGSGGLESRFLSVSVERGWTSKRDFIGSYNPLTKTVDRNNLAVFQALEALDREVRSGKLELPLVVLLDEANLSPMEHYWSDFMAIADDQSGSACVNLGENYAFRIPETLHFAATINNDDTTEPLSPRLVDRAFVITLPDPPQVWEEDILDAPQEMPEAEGPVSWASLRQAFLDPESAPAFGEIRDLFQEVLEAFAQLGIHASPRTAQALYRYWRAAASCFEAEETEGRRVSPGVCALDFAAAQKLIPKISGSGDGYRSQLSLLQRALEQRDLLRSAKLVKEILDRGDQPDQMQYFRFFH